LRANAITYSAGARPASAGAAAAGQLHYGAATQVEWGIDPAFCSHMKDDGFQCGARPAKGTGLCAGHMRSVEGQ
jgi:hypothetical protein